MCAKDRQDTPLCSGSAAMSTTARTPAVMGDPRTLVTATVAVPSPYRASASSVSADPPLADTATTTVASSGAGSRSVLASTAVASTPRARRRAAPTELA